MDEIGFVFKSFFVAAFAVFLMQMQVGEGKSVEGVIVGYMKSTWATQWMKDMGAGASRATASVYDNTIGGVVKSSQRTLNKLTDVKGEMKAAEDAGKAREAKLLDIENQ